MLWVWSCWGQAPWAGWFLTYLLVTPAVRGAGLARALLDQDGSFAMHAGLGLVLDVVDDAADAIAVYEHLGWRLVDCRPAVWTTDDGLHPLLRAYALT